MNIRRQDLQKAMEGKTFTMTNGKQVTVLQYESNKQIHVLREDGKEMYIHKSQLKDAPTAPVRKDYIIGQTYPLKTGDIVTVVDYRDDNHIDVQFPDGSIRTKVSAQACDKHIRRQR